MRVCTGIALVVPALPIWAGSAQPPPGPAAPPPPFVTVAEPPAGAETLRVQWIKIVVLGQGTILAAVARPTGAGPFPAVVLLHGSHGFAREYVRLAQALSHEGILTVAACWFAGGGNAAQSRFITPIAWHESPPRPDSSSAAAWQTVDTLVEAARALPGTRPDCIGLFGHSRGGGAAARYVMTSKKVRAVVLNSTGYPSELIDRASQMNVPMLIFHGTLDSPADGGGENSNIQMARNYEAALRRLKKPVETKYYEGSGHSGIFASPTQFEDEVKRMTTFFLRHLVPN